MLEVARLLTVYDADTRGFNEKSKDVEGTLEKLSSGSVFGGFVAGQLFMQATTALRGLAAEGVTAYANFERLGMSLESLAAREALSTGQAKNMEQALAMSGEKAQELIRWIQELAIKSPFTREGVAAAFRQAQAYGFTADEAQRLTQAMIDFAAGSGASEGVMSQMALALGQVQAKGKLAGQEILQLVNAGLPVQQILADAFGKSTAEIAKMTERGLIPANAAIDAIIQNLEENFGGAAARQSESIAGLTNALSDLKEINLTAFFGGFFEETMPYLEEFTDALSDPAMQENLAALGQSAGELVVALVEGGTQILSIWESMPDWMQNATVAMVGMGMATPPLINGLGQVAVALNNWGGTLKSIPGFLRDVNAAQSLLKEGADVFSVMSTGAAGVTAALGPLALALAAVTAIAVTYTQTIGKAQAKGMAANTDAWAEALGKVAEQGGDAEDVILAYADAIEHVNAAHESGGWVANLFVDNQAIIRNGFAATIDALGETSSSWDEYSEAIQRAAQMAGYQVDEQGRIYTLMRQGGGVTKKYIDDLGNLTRTEWVLADAIANASDYMDGHELAARAASNALAMLEEQAMPIPDILSELKSALSAEGIEGAAQIYEDIATALGVFPSAAEQAANDVALLSEAFAMGLVDQQQYVDYMQQAQEGTLSLSAETRGAVQGMMDNAYATREAAGAAAEAAKNYWGLAESLKGASNAQIAKEMLSQLGQLLQGDAPNVELYNAAYKDIAFQFGLVNDKSMALAGGLPQLFSLMSEGVIPAQNIGEALKTMMTDAADGQINWDNLIEKFGIAPGVIAPVTENINSLAGATGEYATILHNTTMRYNEDMTRWSDKAKNTTVLIKDAFSAVDWPRIGVSVTEGIASGISQGTPAIEKAATAAALSAYDAAMAALDAHSPSRKGMYVGEMFIAGQVAGLRRGSEDLAQAALYSSGQIVTGAAQATTVNVSAPSAGGGVTVENAHFNFADTTLTPEKLQEAMRQMEWLYG